MKLIPTILCAVVAAGLIAGCEKKKEEIPAAVLSQDAPFPERIEAAANMKDAQERDNMLRRIAMDAAVKKDADSAIAAIQKLDPKSQDDVAGGVARMLARLQDVAGAAKVADIITSPETKAQVMAEIGGR